MATDQEIRDAGFKYVPKQKYLQNPYNLPIAPVPPPPPDGGIVNTNAFNNSGGNDFSVYNPDPNSIVNRDYRPNYDYRQFSEYDSDPSTADIKQMDMNQNYFYEPPPSKLEGLMGMIPYAGSFMRGANFLGNQISPYLPVNKRRIMENELGGQGVMVNSIGQIVQGEGGYDTAANVMAGYNPYHMTAETFDKRLKRIDKTMQKDGYEGNLQKRRDAIEEAKTNFLNAQSKTDKIYDFEEDEKEKKKKDTIVGRFLTKRKETKAAKEAKAAEDAVTAATTSGTTNSDGFTYDTNTTGQASSNEYGTYTPSVTPQQAQDNQDRGRGQQNQGGGGGASYSNSEQTGAKDGYGYGLKEGGRAGYFFGGRVNYKTGGRIGFQGGGSDASSDDFGTSTSAPGPGDTGGEGGNNPSDGSDTQFGGGNNNDGASDNPPVTVVKNNPVDISTVTKSVGDYDIPYGVEALLANKGRFKAVINPDEILDKNVGAEFTYDQGPFSIGAYADMDGDKSLNANYTRNNSNYSFDLNDGGGQLKFTRTFANGGLAGLL